MHRLLIAFACLALLVAGGACKKSRKHKGAEIALPAPVKQVQERVNITVDDDGFHPKEIEAVQGKPITLIFKREVEKTCNTMVIFPSEDIRRPLPLNQPVRVLLIPGHPGTIQFNCPANSHTGQLNVD